MSDEREIIEAATPGPWERGNHWRIQDAVYCTCHDSYGPLTYYGPVNINGKSVLAHVHRRDKPSDTTGITTTWLDQHTHKPLRIIKESEEYGLMEDCNARFISHFNPKHVALMEDVCEAARRCCVAVSDNGEQWTRTRRLVAAIDALDAYRWKEADE